MPFVKTELGADPIIVEGYLAASPQSVFRAWTDPVLLMRWFGPKPDSLLSADLDLRVGGAWRFVMRDDGTEQMGFEGKYLVVQPSSRLVLSWSKFDTGSTQSGLGQMSQVEIMLANKGSGTDIRIVHSAIEDDVMRTGFSSGWEHGMKNLHDLVSNVPLR